MSKHRKKAILYARFSPRPNAAECDSIEKQIEDMTLWCAANGYEVGEVFEDRALSGSDAERPGIWNAIKALRRGQCLIVRNMDRLARDVLLCEMLLKEIRAKGARVVSISGEGTEQDSPEATFIRQIFQAFAQYQRAIIRAKTKAGMLRHQSNGRRMSAPDRTPYGWRPDPDNPMQMLEDPVEQRVIEKVVAWHDQGDSFRKIARELGRRGLPCRGGEWHHSTVKAILRRADKL